MAYTIYYYYMPLDFPSFYSYSQWSYDELDQQWQTLRSLLTPLTRCVRVYALLLHRYNWHNDVQFHTLPASTDYCKPTLTVSYSKYQLLANDSPCMRQCWINVKNSSRLHNPCCKMIRAERKEGEGPDELRFLEYVPDPQATRRHVLLEEMGHQHHNGLFLPRWGNRIQCDFSDNFGLPTEFWREGLDIRTQLGRLQHFQLLRGTGGWICVW